LGDSSHLKFSPDGKSFVSGDFVNERVWDAGVGKLLWETKRGFGQVYSIEFSPDGRKIVIAADGDCRLWDAATGKPPGPSHLLC
jgi:WD40 repeat protein